MKLYIVGAGPGAPDLITVRGAELLAAADAIFYTDSLVSAELIERYRKPGADVFHTAGMHLEEMAAAMAKQVKQGRLVVRVHTGDPSIYGATLEQIALLKEEGIEVEIVPGVSSAFAAAAAVQAELTVPELTQTVIFTRAEGRTPMPPREKLRELARHHCTLVLFLSATLAKKVSAALLEAGWSGDTPVAIVYKATWPDEIVIRSTVATMADDMRRHGVTKHAIMLAGWALDPHIHERGYRSKLYDPAFTHGYRKGEA
ncbi:MULTISPECIES: precorrin-4 C(11)-methyltransferase [Geobacillus]|uniref:Precorrin-4 C(11)-methyltransferase n=1 Tax=Geobacillus thermocatenulatus TaxID=33938 RepID=A0A226Q1B5_9BACL|nr:MULTISPECIES: precorrin-4 C(11)-methyltransferase [Geobacillus]ASS99427.1 precorrin-4 C(11)-methyltransferase [Geobacillus thermocatenulatus]KLR73162.1 cobalt-precorrin-4 C(11)-methyltransferase [Geobacillus sp. T6]OXB85828.1 precorrin-4 C(11)-methyltransferase [Geobacillus thermocatenulatus]